LNGTFSSVGDKGLGRDVKSNFLCLQKHFEESFFQNIHFAKTIFGVRAERYWQGSQRYILSTIIKFEEKNVLEKFMLPNHFLTFSYFLSNYPQKYFGQG